MSPDDVVLARAFKLEARLNVLERRGVAWKAVVLEEVKRLRVNSVKARENYHERRGGADAPGTSALRHRASERRRQSQG